MDNELEPTQALKGKLKLSIKTKLVVPIIAVFIVLALAVSLYFPAKIGGLISQSVEEKLSTMAIIYGDPIKSAMSEGNYEVLLELTKVFEKIPGIAEILILDEEKDPLFTFPEETEISESTLAHLDKDQIYEDSGVMRSVIQLRPDGEENVIGILVIGFSLTERDKEISGNTITIIVSSIIFSVFCIALLYFVSNILISPIIKVSDGLKDIAQGEGDLTKRLEIKSYDEVGELSLQFNIFMDKIHHIIAMVKDTTMQVTTSSFEITTAVDEQGVVSTEQSTSVSQITSTMEELSASSTQIADHSQSVVDLSTTALRDTEKGSVAVEAVMLKMDEINRDNQKSIGEIVELGNKSKEINKVMEIINNVADQTKLIAFNAAIEASSAGEAGKRFAVVAAEIRRLADNVTESTGEIEAKIGEIQEAINRLVIASENSSNMIQEGMDSTSQTVGMLKEVLKGAYSTSDAAKQISLSTQQQKTANNQVLMSLREIDEGVKKTSTSIKQTSEITNNLADLSNSLKQLVDSFKLSEKGVPKRS